jgi:hypothetical protein
MDDRQTQAAANQQVKKQLTMMASAIGDSLSRGYNGGNRRQNASISTGAKDYAKEPLKMEHSKSNDHWMTMMVEGDKMTMKMVRLVPQSTGSKGTTDTTATMTAAAAAAKTATATATTTDTT